MDPLTMGLMYGGGSLLSGLGGMLGGQTQANASRASGQMGLLGAILAGQAAEQGYQRASSALSPYVSGGSKAFDLLQSYLTGNNAQTAGIGGGGPNLLSTFAPTQAQLEGTPGYQFALSQGLKATQNAAAGKGLGTGGVGMQQATDYATGLASTTFQQQLQNYLTQNQQAFNMLFQPTQLGGQAASSLAGAATNASQLIGNAAMGGGNVMAQGIMGAGNALSGGTQALTGAVGNALQMPYMASFSNYGRNPYAVPTTTNYGYGGPGFTRVVGGAGDMAIPTI